MSGKFYNVLWYECAWYFLGTSQPSKFVCMQCLSISCLFSCTNNTAAFRFSLPHEDGFGKAIYSYIKVHTALFVMNDYDPSTNET